MAKSKSKSRRIIDVVLIVAIVLSVGLVVAEMATNLADAIASQTETEPVIEEKPTAVPTLTEQEWRDLLSEPVGEDGN